MPEVFKGSKNKKSFFDLFPTPKFLFLTTTGLSLSGHGIEFVEFKQNGHKEFDLRHFASAPLPQGAVVAGSIQDKEAVTKVLSELRDKYDLRFIKATLPEEKAYTFTTQIDKKPFNTLRDRIAFIIEENVPVSLAESVFDFEIIGETNHESVIRVAVSVLPTEVVEGYANIFESAKLYPVSFEIESQAIARAVIPRGDDRPYLILNIGYEKTSLYIAEDEIVQFSSTVGFGSKEEEGEYSQLKNLSVEISKIFGFWNTRLDLANSPQKKIERVLITGRCSSDSKFISLLTKDLPVPYDLANVWINALSLENAAPKIPFEESFAYAAAIGIALPDKEPRYV